MIELYLEKELKLVNHVLLKLLECCFIDNYKVWKCAVNENASVRI